MRYYDPNNTTGKTTRKAKAVKAKTTEVKAAKVEAKPVLTPKADTTKYSNKILAKLQEIEPSYTYTIEDASTTAYGAYSIKARKNGKTRNILIGEWGTKLLFTPGNEENKPTETWKSVDIHNIPRTTQRICKDLL